MTLRVGLVGRGFGEKVIAPALRRVKGARLEAVATRDWKVLVENPRVDAVAIAVPPAAQPPIVALCLRLKKPVFCEKPLSPLASVSARMADSLRKARLAAAVDFEFRALPAWMRAQELLGQKAIGRLREFRVDWSVETYAVRHGLDSWKTRPVGGGGALAQFASHSVDAAEWFAGRIVRLRARLVRPADLKGKAETGVLLDVETRSGAFGQIAIATHAPGEFRHAWTFLGSEGRMVLENRGADYGGNFGLTLSLRGKPAKTVVAARVPREDGRIEPVARLLQRWVDAVRLGKTMVPGAVEGARADALLEAARKSDKTGKWVNCG